MSLLDERAATAASDNEDQMPPKPRSWVKKLDISMWLWRLAIIPIVILLWQGAYELELASRTLLPRPSAVWDAAVDLHRSGELWTNLWSTVQASIIALAIAAAIGVPLGIMLGMLPRTWAVLGPYLNALNSMPRIAFAPVLIVVFGIGQGSKIALGISIAVFIFMMNARAGVMSADSEHRRMCVTLGASKLQLFRKLYIPVAIPAIFTAFRLGMVYALLGVVSSEIIASRVGMGQIIASYSATLSLSYVYAALIILAIFASILTLAAGSLENSLLRWQHAGEQS
ncbi:ABC transporter permease [Rhodococcus sp. NPDC055024]